MIVEKSIEISASPDKIWSLMAKPEEVLKWYLPLQRFDYTSDQHGGVGAPLYFEEKAGGRVMKFDCVITEWAENEKLAFKMVSGNMAKSYEERWTIEATPTGSIFTFMEQINLGYWIFGKILVPFVKRASGATIKKMLAELKRLAES